MSRRWLITGCSTGLGRVLAEAAAREGDIVVATARRYDRLRELAERHPDVVVPMRLDVCDPRSCASVVADVVDRLGGVDVLVNNAGFGVFGAVEDVDDSLLDAQLRTNLFGAWRMTRLVLPIMRAQRSGHVVMVSSVSGVMAIPGFSAYTASKFALEGMAETLAVEAAHTGVKVTIAEPGGFATDYTSAMTMTPARTATYEPMLGPVRRACEGTAHSSDSADLRDFDGFGDPELFATEIVRAVASDDPPLRLPVGADAWQVITKTFDARRDALRRLAATRDAAVTV